MWIYLLSSLSHFFSFLLQSSHSLLFPLFSHFYISHKTWLLIWINLLLNKIIRIYIYYFTEKLRITKRRLVKTYRIRVYKTFHDFFDNIIKFMFSWREIESLIVCQYNQIPHNLFLLTFPWQIILYFENCIFLNFLNSRRPVVHHVHYPYPNSHWFNFFRLNI